MSGLWRAFLIQLLCLHYDAHDVFPKRTGLCKRCGLYVNEEGRTQR